MATSHSRQDQTTKYAWTAGLTTFAAVMLTISGLIAIFRGIMGIAQDDVFLVTNNYVFEWDLTGWGWLHVILGAIAVIIGVGLFRAPMWARVGGVAIAALIMIANFLSLPYYPVWSVVTIAISGFVIWALCVGRRDDMREY
ncbi:hypothetical protein [Streptomyces sp. NPDC056628]|uniref:DUF7144 family membrane protein n=1 Tax=Streptomyces sp. NPDC056628 TaxID=3345882 RepID=UPI0036986C25